MATEVVDASAMREKRPGVWSARPRAMTSGLPYDESSGPRAWGTRGLPHRLPPLDDAGEIGERTGVVLVLGDSAACHGASVGRGDNVGVGRWGTSAWNGEICHGWHTFTG